MYQVEVLNNDAEIEFTLELDSIETVAGILAAGMGIAADIEYEYGERFWFRSNVTVTDFRLLNNMEQIVQYTDKIQDGFFGIWLRGSKRFKHSLFTYQTDDFLEGIMWICKHFGLEYKNYIPKLPFDNLGNLHSILGDYMPQWQIAEDAPDLDDYEDDEARDENIIEPLARTDDIITLKEE